MKCSTCNGTGETVVISYDEAIAVDMFKRMTRGRVRGKVRKERVVCPQCDGTGRM
jgi:DnaJ-class molecular chaperone